MRRPRAQLRGLIFVWISSVATSAFAGTCSLCRESLKAGGNLRLIEGYYWSIILLVSIPLVVIGVGLKFAWKSYR